MEHTELSNFYSGTNGVIKEFGAIKNGSVLTFAQEAAKIRFPEDFFIIQPNERVVALAYTFQISDEAQNTFIRLKNLPLDLDVYLGRIDPETAEPIKTPQGFINYSRSSTNRGFKDESLFQRLEPGRYYLEVWGPEIDLFQQPLLGELGSQFSIEIDTSSFDKNSRLSNDPLLRDQWYLFNNGTRNEGLIEVVIGINDDGEAGTSAGGIAGNVDIVAPEAWKITTDASKVVVAVVDAGVGIDHPDLKENIWVNTNEVPGNLFDDDGNGYVDDINGWNFSQESGDPSPTRENTSHGTHVAGTIGARGNNSLGVAGVAWTAQIMGINVSNDNGIGLNGDYIASGIRYAVENGASIINLSIGGNIKVHPDRLIDYLDNEGRLIDDSSLPYDILRIKEAYMRQYALLEEAQSRDVLVVKSAGNEGAFSNDLAYWEGQGDTDKSLDIRAFLNRFLDNIIVVGSSNAQDLRSYFSSYGVSVDISAPGGDVSLTSSLGILSTVDDFNDISSTPEELAAKRQQGISTNVGFVEGDAKYAFFQGTSMSAPVVSGSAALIRSKYPDLTAEEVKEILVLSADKNPRLEGIAGEEGLSLNLYKALVLAGDVANGTIALTPYEETIRSNGKRDLIGTEANQKMIGSNVNEIISGNGGEDQIKGFGGRDTLIGGDDGDVLIGGKGTDIYLYTSSTQSLPSTSDLIDFNQGDRIDISRLLSELAQGVKFTFIGDNHFTGLPGQVRATSYGLSSDFNGDQIPEFRVAFKQALGFEISASDLILM
jgi:subtilisin family serine protease